MARYHFSGIASILNEYSLSAKPVILDLGATSASTFAFFSSKRCKIYFENLNEFIVEHSSLPMEAFNKKIDDYLQNYDSGTRFDIILAWDMLNYLELESVERLMNRLHPHCRPGTVLHIIRYPGRKIPARPCEFSILASREFAVSDFTLAPRKVENHSTYKLLKHMSHFFMQNDLRGEGPKTHFVEYTLRYQTHGQQHKVFTSTVVGERPTRPNHPGQQHYTPGISALCQHLRKLRAASILDLGPKIGGNINFFYRYSKQVYVEDLYSSIRWWQQVESHSSGPLSQQALNYEAGLKFDAIFLWDILNYCTPEQIAQIGNKLSRHCAATTRVFVILYTSVKQPESPQRFYLESESRLRVISTGKMVNKSYKLTTTELFKLLPIFKPKNSFLLQQGMLSGVGEYLFGFQVSDA